MFWEEAGRENTEKTVVLALEEVRRRGIGHVVVASNTGETIRKLMELDVQGLNLVCVTHHVGFKGPGIDEMSPEMRRCLADTGVKVLTTTHVLAGVDRTFRKKYGGLYPPEIVANTLRMFGQGMKVAVEISIMALDAGMIPYGEDTMAISGTGTGADTACVVRPGHSNEMFNTRIVDIICRPKVN
jgi:hypothetical protein